MDICFENDRDLKRDREKDQDALSWTAYSNLYGRETRSNLYGRETRRRKFENCGYGLPDVFSERDREYVIEGAGKYYEDCVAIAAIPREKFVELVAERFDEDKKDFAYQKVRMSFDILNTIPDNLIEAYMKAK